MYIEAVRSEKPESVFSYKGIDIEVVRCPETIWCGALGYAEDNESEPDISGLLARYQDVCRIPKNDQAMQGWSCCISIDYWKGGTAKRGIMFAQQVLTAQQESVYDVYSMPESLYARVKAGSAASMAAFGRQSCAVHELFGFLREATGSCGYVPGDNGAQEIEMYGPESAYAYVQIMKK